MIKPVLIIMAAAVFLAAPGTAPAGLTTGAPDETGGAAGRPFLFLPSAGILAEGGAFSGSDAGFTGLHRKTLDLHVISYGRFDCTFLLTEDTLTTDRYSSRFYPYRIKYIMDYFYLSWRIAGTTLGVMMDHICYNVIDKTGDTDPEQLRWYGAGIRWESLGMKTGMKDHAAPFGALGSFAVLDRLQYMLYAGASLHTERFKYAYIFRGAFRYDLPGIAGMVPYLEGSFQALADHRVRVDRSVETGARFRLAGVHIIPFINWSYRHDALLYEGGSDSAWLFGLRMESLLGAGPWQGDGGAGRHETSWPELHFSGGYGKHADSAYLGFLTELGVSMDLVRAGNVSVFLASDLAHSSRAQGNALYPRYLEYDFQAGANWFFLSGMYAALLYEHGRRHDGNDYRGVTERYHLAGMMLATRGMRRGSVDHASGPGPDVFLNRLEWRVFAGLIIEESNYPYNRDLRAALRWDIARLLGAVPYLSPDLRVLSGRGEGREYGMESGIRFSAGIALMLYHRYERTIDIDAAGGAAERHHLFGFRVER